jgi:5'-nucleotidase
MMTRRRFLASGVAGLASLGLAPMLSPGGRWARDAGAAKAGGGTRGIVAGAGGADGDALLTILHTNDVHSRIDPFPEDGSRNAGRGGAARRATLIRRVRAESPHTLVVDAGDTFQGTPYFNLFKGVLDFKVMSALGYDVMTLGNHDFDGGVEGLMNALPQARFDIVNANYDFSGSPLADHVRPFVVRETGPARVGLFGLGVLLEGLVTPALCRGVTYGAPVPAAQRMVQRLRTDERCNVVVCLSHLGKDGYGGEIGDEQLAAEVPGIDLIVGGHSHTFMDEPLRVRHGERETLVFQVGWAGINLGRVDFRLREGRVVSADAGVLPVDADVPEGAGISRLWAAPSGA